MTEKPENKTFVVHDQKTICKSECIVADSTESIKLVLWESNIDKVNA